MKKFSKAEARRLAAQRQADEATPDPLKPELRAKLSAYRPHQLDEDTWNRIRPVHHDIMSRSKTNGMSNFVNRCSDLAAYLGWRVTMDLDIAVRASMTFASIDDYHRRGDRDRINDTNWDSRHSRLRNLARRVNPGLDAPIPATTSGYKPVKAPYTLGESLTIRRLAVRQRSPVIRRQLCAIVGLSEGAGLSSADLRDMFGRHVVDLGDEGIRVDIPGKNARTVWVRRSHEDLVRIGIEGVAPGALVIGQRRSRKNVTTTVIAKAELYGDDLPSIEASRLRSTWLTWLLTRPIDLRTTLRVAGLSTARSLQDLLVYVDDAPDTARDLRDGVASGPEGADDV